MMSRGRIRIVSWMAIVLSGAVGVALPAARAVPGAVPGAGTAREGAAGAGAQPERSPAGAGVVAGPALEVISAGAASRLLEKGAHVIDARPAAKYFAGHIPGAVHLSDGALRAPRGGVPVRLHETGELARLLGASGVTFDRPVIVCSDGDDPLAATLVAYALGKLGHPSVRILNGGFEAWRGSFPTSQEFPSDRPAEAAPSADAWARAASSEDVRGSLFDDQVTFVDARPATQYRGEGRLWRRNGHIPGAVSVDWRQLMDKDNPSLFRSRAEIEKLLADAGVERTDDVIVYCGTGREATLLYLYLSQVLAYPRVRLFEGSWTEYSADDSLPVATGTDPFTVVYRDGDVLISGQPSEELLRQFADDGVAVVINCRTPEEASAIGFDEGRAVAALGMTYVEVPLGGKHGYRPEDSTALSGALRAHAGKRVLIHCATGGRSTTLWMSHLVRSEGLTVEQAMDRARRAGMLRSSALERLIGSERSPGGDAAGGPGSGVGLQPDRHAR